MPIVYTFKEWIVLFKGVNQPIGDLAADVEADANFPETTEYGPIHAYLASKASQRVLDVFDECYAFYKASHLDEVVE
jgi:uncharacterized protein YozE (UPF0346 family)